ncbi:MAG: cyclopropane-fatty-acyl-phospholipid synthase family protein [Gammaproteobacteria bacterium]|nr:cyclopropane-fatty-acyl-phospholipid synthase family protein [Gammaproteobacteria bacterium]
MSVLTDAAESGLVPDAVVRLGIRRLVAQRLREEYAGDPHTREERGQRLLHELAGSEVALETDAANAQHYEVPADFFRLVLGRHLKYSCADWDSGAADLDSAETAMLESYVRRAGLADGQQVLDLGCGWGSLTLWAAARFPASRFTAVSNSSGQRRLIEERARELGLGNVSVITADVNTLELDGGFDRILSVEMFEHVRNYAVLLERIAGWLNEDGKLFVHIFCHRNLLYPFEDKSAGDWMARHFFTGGLMPAADTLLFFQEHLRIERRWTLSGSNYAKTARAWLANLDARRDAVTPVLAGTYGEQQARRWLQRWRMFFMACEEMFAYRHGTEWLVCHYLFAKPN